MVQFLNQQMLQLLGALSVRNVAGHFGGPDHTASFVAQRRYGKRDIDPASIFCDPYGFEMIDALAPSELGEDTIFFRMKLRRNEGRDVLSDDLIGLIPEDACCPRIPRCNHALQRLADNCVVRRDDNRREFRQLQFDLVTVGHVHQKIDRAS